MMLGVFCRVNHPAGYGAAPGIPWPMPDDIAESMCTNAVARANARARVAEVLHREGEDRAATDEAILDGIVDRLMPRQPPMTGAHGYVTLVVHAPDADTMIRVQERLTRWFQWKDRGDAWYAGTYDLVWANDVSMEGTFVTGLSRHPDGVPRIEVGLPRRGGSWRSIGDNRAVAYLSSGDILNPDPA